MAQRAKISQQKRVSKTFQTNQTKHVIMNVIYYYLINYLLTVVAFIPITLKCNLLFLSRFIGQLFSLNNSMKRRKVIRLIPFPSDW